MQFIHALFAFSVILLSSNDDDTIIEEIFEYLDEGQKVVDFHGKSDFIVLLGLSGSGKSTLAHYMSGDPDTLVGIKKSGELIYNDTEGKIGQSLSKSHTTYPDVYLDLKNQEAVVDCPGFEDTRNASLEITASYFIKKVFEKSTNVKIVVTVINYNVRPGGETRYGLDMLLKNVVMLVKDVDKYADGISLIVTKVPFSQYNDSEEVENIKEFLTEFKEGYNEDLQEATDEALKNELIAKIKLLDVILDKRINRMAVFRAPEKLGPISNSTYSLVNKESIREVVFDSLNYVKSDIKDYNFPLSLASQSVIKERIYVEINKRVTNLLTIVTSQIFNRFQLMGETSESMMQLRKDISHLYGMVFNVDVSNNSRETFEKLVLLCIQYLNANINFSIRPDSFSMLLDQFEFFHSFSDEHYNPYEKWVLLFDTSREYSKYLNNWYTVLYSVYDMAADIDIQKLKHLQFDPDFLNMKYYVSKTNIQDFLKKIESSQLTEYPDELHELIADRHAYLTDFIIRDSNIILNLIRPNITCGNGTFYVRSNFVSITSDVISHVNVDCPNVTALNIMAFENMYVNAEIEFHNTDISIIAMNWVVVYKSKVDISGSNAVPRDPPKAATSNQQQKFDGVMGLPGKSGGHILGLAFKIDQPQLLNIISNGGIGGRAQDGGDGVYDDFDNQFPDYLATDSEQDLLYRCSYAYITCTKTGQEGGQDLWTFTDRYAEVNQSAGDGGKSGYGGYPGPISILLLNSTAHPIQNSELGKIGEMGMGGSGWKLSVTRAGCKKENSKYICRLISREPKHLYRGLNDISTLSEEKPYNRSMPFDRLNDFIQYKFYILETKFLYEKEDYVTALTSHPNVLSFYNIHGFISEITLLESTKYNIKSNLLKVYVSSMLPVLQSWNTTNYDDKQVMVFLTSTLSSIIWHMRVRNETVFVTDLYTYVELALQSIQNLNQLGIIEAVENIKQKYSSSIDQNILEAQNYITIFVNKEFEKIFTGIQGSVDDLVTEVNTLIDDVNAQIEELKEKERQLRKNMVLHCVFGVLNVASAALQLLGPVGTAAGVALGAASSITEGLVVGDVNLDSNNPITLPNGIRNLLKDMQALKSGRREGHKEALVFTCDSYLTVPDIGEDDKKKVIEIRTTALTLTDISNIKDADKIIQDSIKKLKEINKNIKPGEHVDFQKMLNSTLKILNYAEKASQIAGPVLDAMKKYQGDQAKFEIVLNMIKADEQKLNDIGDFKDGIFEVITPLLDSLHKDMSELEDELRNQSSVSLIVKRWAVGQSIRKMSDMITRFTEGFEVEKNFIKHFYELQEASSLVLTLFDQIQYYQEHKQFADYIGNLQQVGGGLIPDNSVFKNELLTLKKSIVSNTVKAQCSAIIKSFTQQVFPFADYHLGSLIVHNGEYCEGDDQTVVTSIITVSDELKRIRSTIMAGVDVNVQVGVFDSSYVSTPSFAIWDHNTYGSMINRLFQGEEVALMAPIIGQKNAVKFNKVQIRFNRTDGGNQNELDDALKKFTMVQTHFGNSMYKCDDLTFLIRSEPLTMTYTLEMDKNGEPLIQNAVYKKLKQGDIALSPYTMWRLQLRETYSREGDFSGLKQFANKNVNIDMFGTGQFVDKNNNICKSRLEKYYDTFSPMI